MKTSPQEKNTRKAMAESTTLVCSHVERSSHKEQAWDGQSRRFETCGKMPKRRPSNLLDKWKMVRSRLVRIKCDRRSAAWKDTAVQFLTIETNHRCLGICNVSLYSLRSLKSLNQAALNPLFFNRINGNRPFAALARQTETTAEADVGTRSYYFQVLVNSLIGF